MAKEINLALSSTDKIKNKIYTLRGMQVMLDADLAVLYNVETKQINRAVKRNSERFPNDFMFQISLKEFDTLKSQVVTSNTKDLRFQFGTSRLEYGGRRYLPYAFTEQGVAMLSGVLRSGTAIKVSIQIMSTFVAMRRFISSNAQIFHRLDVVETKQIEHDKKFDDIFDALQSRDIKPEKGIFFDGQIFDSYKFVSDIMRNAHISIVLIDNYIDDSVLTLFSKRNKNVAVTIFTKEIPKQLSLDLAKYNLQYPFVEVKEFTQSHDRFLIIDNKEVYHFGASLKDLGKKWFAFSRFDKEAFKLLDKLGLK
ncbi:ORF6N domain-containing protein [Candidatus Woesearchaeota archaeon]|nr:ORF6N domain-containing protein [Candidatus Woesearchaeota archaeon]